MSLFAERGHLWWGDTEVASVTGWESMCDAVRGCVGHRGKICDYGINAAGCRAHLRDCVFFP